MSLVQSHNKLKKKQLWQEAMADLITDPRELIDLLKLDHGLLEEAQTAARLFPLRVPRGFVERMEKGNPRDPLLLQVLPLGAELASAKGYVSDPVGDQAVNPVPGLLHKYAGRVLVMLTGACAVHCRYCFRREFPYEDNIPGRQGWDKMLAYIQSDETISEVILSGGDPLAVSDALLRQFTDRLKQIAHVKRLRIHTRVPIVLPERITDEFMQWARDLNLQLVIVMHANHARELSPDVIAMLKRLDAAGVTLLNQTVLLKGINDNVKDLAVLSEVLFAAKVLPYYLHALDKVSGSAHFDLDLTEARSLHAELMQVLPGYLVPRLVSEISGELSKTLL